MIKSGADALFDSDIKSTVSKVSALSSYFSTQSEYDAVCSITYNAGPKVMTYTVW